MSVAGQGGGQKGETLLFITHKTGCNDVMSGSETNTALGEWGKRMLKGKWSAGRKEVWVCGSGGWEKRKGVEKEVRERGGKE